MERIDRNTWRTDNGDEVRAQGLTLTVEFGERTKAKVLCAVEAVRAENAELRELVKDMWQTISRNDGCGWDMDANCCTSDECNVSRRYWYRMKELGIETDDD